MNDLAVQTSTAVVAAPLRRPANFWTHQLKILGNGSMEDGIRYIANAVPLPAAHMLIERGLKIGRLQGAINGCLATGGIIAIISASANLVKAKRRKMPADRENNPVMSHLRADSPEKLDVCLQILHSQGISSSNVSSEINSDGQMEYLIEVSLTGNQYDEIKSLYGVMCDTKSGESED